VGGVGKCVVVRVKSNTCEIEREQREGARTVITMQEACRAQRIQLAIRT